MAAVSLQHMLSELDERTIARRVGQPHDEARLRYSLRSNTVPDFDAFSNLIGDYVNAHLAACVSGGGRLAPGDARSHAKQLLTEVYRRRNGDIVTAFNDAQAGTNGGLRVILDHLAEALKAEAVERYTRDAFDRHVAPNDWDAKVELIRQFMTRFGPMLGSAVRMHQPEAYARDYEPLIRAYVAALQQTSAIFRRF
jgi:hypothetical protein